VTPNGGKAFSLTGSDASVGTAGQAGFSQANLGDCNNDFLIIPNGHDPALPASPANLRDRYCGERLNVLPKSNMSTTVCSKNNWNTNNCELIILNVLVIFQPRISRTESSTTPTATRQ
jgi:hypothetical protein